MKKQTITIYDVAREAGVSMATVSRVVNGNPNVKPSTRKKVNEVIERLNYRPNAVARGLASRKTTTVGVIIPSVTNLFFSALARGIDDIATMYKYHIILTNSDENTEKELQVIYTLVTQQVDGIIYMGYRAEPEVIEELEKTNIPYVLAGTVPADKEEDILSVNIDYFQAVKESVNYLLETVEKVALVIENRDWSINRNYRIPAFYEALADHSLTKNDGVILENKMNFENADKITDELLEYGVQAAVVGTDDTAIGILNNLENRGIHLPDDFQIISSNNSLVTQYARPQLSSIQLPLYDIGAVSMRLLTKVMNSEPIEDRQVILPHRIIHRGSTRLVEG